MAAKRKKKLDSAALWEQDEVDEVLISLKERYFRLAKREEIGQTPQVTSTLDKLEKVINTRKEQIINENS